MGKPVKSAMSASEIVDIVEEQLAWMAVLSESTSAKYVADDFRFASPFLERAAGVGAFIHGDELISANVNDVPEDIWREVREERAPLSEALSILPVLGSALRYAEFGNWGDEVSITSCAMVKSGAVTLPPRLKGVRLYRIQSLAMGRDGAERESYVEYFGLHSAGALVDLAGRPLDHATSVEVADRISVAARKQYAVRDSWRVQMALSAKRTGVGIETDSVGARALVRAVDSGNTPRQRRTSLVHWVQAHYRKSRRPDGDPTFVRAHLRGATTYQASGLFLTIQPSRVDIEAACNGVRYST